MTKKEFLKICADIEEFWSVNITLDILDYTCHELTRRAGWRAKKNFYSYFNIEKDEYTFISWGDGNSPKIAESCRVIYFKMWVYYCLDEKLYKNF